MAENLVSLRVLSIIPHLIPGIEQAILIHYQQTTGNPTGHILKATETGHTVERIKVESGNSFFLELVNRRQQYSWFSRDQIPFEVRPNKKVQLTIFNEFKNSVLLLTIRAEKDDHSDLFFIYLNENMSNFVLEKATESFSAQHKTIVGSLLYHSVQTMSRIFLDQEELTGTFHDQIRAVVMARDQLNNQLEMRENKERLEIVKLAQHYLQRISGELGWNASFTDSARIRLRDFRGELSQLEGVVRDAIAFAGAISPPTGNSPLLVADYHIRFPQPVAQTLSAEVQSGLTERMVKTHLLLDRLEHAAVSIKQRKAPLTSINVGQAFPTPISAPAITDALKKHKKRIVQLFDQYPDKWETIRHEFRPVQNLLNSLSGQESLSA